MGSLQGSVSERVNVPASEMFGLITWRKTLLARIRHRSLREEVRTSIHEAERIVAPRAG